MIKYLVLAGLLALLLVGNVVVTHDVLTAPHPGHNDFMSRWEGARSFWVDGLNPYGDEASLNIQRRIYGRAAIGSEDPGLFAYPFYAVFFLWPLSYIPYAWAAAIWMVLLEVCLIGSLFLIMDMYRWRPPLWVRAVLVLWMLLVYFAARGLLLGQVGIVVYLFQALALWALAKERDTLAGIALAFSTLKPQMAFLIVPFLLLWALRAHRRRVVVAFGVTFGVLVLVSFLFQPSWLGDWIAQVRLYPQYTAAAYPDTGSPVWIVFNYYLGLGAAGEWVVNLFFYGLMLWAWTTVLVQNRQERFMWVLMVTLTVTHLVVLRTATTHFVVFIIPLIFYLKLITKHNRRRGYLWVMGILLASLLIPWIHFLITVQDSLEHPTLFLPATFGMMILLWFTRKAWWNADPVIVPGSPGIMAAEAEGNG
jgi:hypothetical protein